MTGVLLAMTLCLQLDGLDLGPVTLTHPLVTAMDMHGRITVQLSLWDAVPLRQELTSRGFTRDQVKAALAPMLLRGPSTEVVKCGECASGAMTWKPKPVCVEGKTGGSPCMTCKVCADPLPEPIASCGEPPTRVRIVR